MKILDWIYPPTCMSCRRLLPLEDSPRRFLWLCDVCENFFEPISGSTCTKCGIPVYKHVNQCQSCFGKTFHFASNKAGFVYDELVRDLMHEIKFRRKRYTAQGMGRLWAKHINEEIFSDNPFLVPLPMHPKKRRERGFNQAEILAQALTYAFKLTFLNCMERIHDTPPQAGLHPKQRAENVMGVFCARKKFDIKGKNIIIIDDIYTTGASLNECSKVLKACGAASVTCMTLAIAVQNKSKNGICSGTIQKN